MQTGPYLGEIFTQADGLLLAALRPRAAPLRSFALLRRDLLVRIRALHHRVAITFMRAHKGAPPHTRMHLQTRARAHKQERLETRTSKSSSSASTSTPTSSAASCSSLLIRFSRMRCLSASLAREIFDETADLRLERRASIADRTAWWGCGDHSGSHMIVVGLSPAHPADETPSFTVSWHSNAMLRRERLRAEQQPGPGLSWRQLNVGDAASRACLVQPPNAAAGRSPARSDCHTSPAADPTQYY